MVNVTDNSERRGRELYERRLARMKPNRAFVEAQLNPLLDPVAQTLWLVEHLTPDLRPAARQRFNEAVHHYGDKLPRPIHPPYLLYELFLLADDVQTWDAGTVKYPRAPEELLELATQRLAIYKAAQDVEAARVEELARFDLFLSPSYDRAPDVGKAQQVAHRMEFRYLVFRQVVLAYLPEGTVLPWEVEPPPQEDTAAVEPAVEQPPATFADMVGGPQRAKEITNVLKALEWVNGGGLWIAAKNLVPVLWNALRVNGLLARANINAETFGRATATAFGVKASEGTFQYRSELSSPQRRAKEELAQQLRSMLRL